MTNKETKALELTQQEAHILVGMVEQAIKSGLPSVADAHNAVVLTGKIVNAFPVEQPEEPTVTEADIVDEKETESKDTDK
jgi:hypothetical protein